MQTTTPTSSQPNAARLHRTRIFIVDDHPMIRERLGEIVARQCDLMVCGEAESPAQALERIPAAKPDLALVDLSFRNADGLDLVKDLRIRIPALKILVVSMHEEIHFVQRSLKAGANGYLCKSEPTANIIAAIRRVLDGLGYVSERMAARVMPVLTHGGNGAGVGQLSDRELQVYRLVGQENSTTQIAGMLHVSVKTVETHIANIREKLHYTNFMQLAQHAFHWVQTQGR